MRSVFDSRRYFLRLSFLFCALSQGLYAFERLPVLVYHHIEDPVKSDVSCTPAAFDAQMQALLRNGFTPINIKQTRLFLAGCFREFRKPILITFDDGYESLFFHAFPVARRLNIPMTVFMITSRAGLQPQFVKYLSDDQIKRMSESGLFDFGSHTDDLHTNIMTIFSAFHSEPNPVIELLRDDLTNSRKHLEKITGRPPIALAWPYGKFNTETTRVARDCGFNLHFTSIPGSNEPGSNPFGIKRIPVTCRDTPESVLRKAAF